MRDKHTFQFTAAKISLAANAEYDYHSKRSMDWRVELDKAIDEAKAKGVDIRQYNVTGGKRAEIIIDPSVQIRINLATEKIESHQRKADRFKIEAAAYKTQGDQVYDLNPDDIVYFRLAGGERDE